jgi:hypothetical protein
MEPNIEDPDGFYAQLIDLHQGLTPEQSRKLNAKLILMMANHIGDRAVLDEILAYAKKTLGETGAETNPATPGETSPNSR